MRYKHISIVGVSLITVVITLSGLMYYFSQDECPVGTFPCVNSTNICVPQRAWCNGRNDCPNGEDEFDAECFDRYGNWDWFIKERNWGAPLCDPYCPQVCSCDQDCFVSCADVGYTEIPSNLTTNVSRLTLSQNLLTGIPASALEPYGQLRSLYLDKNRITELEDGAFINQKELLWLILSENKIREIRSGHLTGMISLEMFLAEECRIEIADLSDFENHTSLEWIGLNKNLITSTGLKLPFLPALKDLFLEENQIEEITEDLFTGLPRLKALSLEGNKIQRIDEKAFQNLPRLRELNLAYNRIVTISSHVFQPVPRMEKLLMGHNPIENLPLGLFDSLRDLRSLGLEEIDMDDMNKNMFSIFPKLDFIYFKKFHYCTTFAPHAQKCQPVSDGVSSLSHLLGKPLLRAAVWGISCVTCLGNALVLWGRLTARDENRVLSIIIRNLAVSDMLMGVYLFAIALEDLRFREIYNVEANNWMASWSCTLVGVLAMTSSEVSVLILTFMSVERFMLIAAPLKGHRALSPQAASSSMVAIWVIGIILALIPAVHWRSSTRFYGVNGMCFPLHIDDPFLVGWEYSAFIFLGLNLLGLVIIGYVYAGMFASIWRTRHATPLSVGDSEFALRFFLIVLTDAACWTPIIALKVIAMTKYPVPPDLHAWVVVFILPVNSAVNPLLYTFTTPKFRERLSEGWFGKIRKYVTRRPSAQPSAQDTQISRTSSNRNMMAVSTGNKIPIEQKVSTVLLFDNHRLMTQSHDHFH